MTNRSQRIGGKRAEVIERIGGYTSKTTGVLCGSPLESRAGNLGGSIVFTCSCISEI